MKVTIYTDGGSRGNPGPAATGIVIKDEDGHVLAAYGEYLGIQTNNFAEYSALISGLHKAKELGAEEVACYLDSRLVCEQLNNNWKVKEPTLQKLFIKAWNACRAFKKVKIEYIPRENNQDADREVNIALDKHLKK